MIEGSTPATPHETRRPIGWTPFRSAHAALARTAAAAPSPMPLALPAVTSPSFLKYGRSAASASRVVSGRMCSSVSKSASPLRVRIGTGATSASKRPSSQPRFARCCDW